MTTAAILGDGRFSAVVQAILQAVGAEARVWRRGQDMAPVVTGANLVFMAVPAGAVAEVAGLYGPHARGDHIVIHGCRGVGESFQLVHQLIRATTCVKKIGVIGGPLHGRDLASGRPMAAVVASRYDEVPAAVRALAAGSPVRVHPSRDVVGVEVANAISNVSALATGMCAALSLGDTARGILLTHGLVEAQRLGCALGGQPHTFTGLAGVGDLIPRSVTSTDRHQDLGRALVEGRLLSDAMAAAGAAVEGVATARHATQIAKRLQLSLPLVEAVCGVLDGEVDAAAAIDGVLRRDDIELGRGLTTPR